MSDRVFVDTNVLICAYDVDAGAKRERAKTLLKELRANRSGAPSIQVLQAFYVDATRKLAKPLTRAAARGVVETYEARSLSPPRSRTSPAPRRSRSATGCRSGTR